MLARSPCAVRAWTLVPTVVSAPRLRQRRPSAIESLTEPPLESSTMVTPLSWRPRANSSKSCGLSAVTMPTALTQPEPAPLQLSWHAIQLNRIGILRSSRVTPACAEAPSVAVAPGHTMHRAAAPKSAQPRKSNDFTNLNLVPSQAPKPRVVAAPVQRQNDSRHTGVSKGNFTAKKRLLTFAAPPPDK